jgi:hypothetical protein
MKARWELAYPGHDIYDCKECTYPRAMPDFGQRREHQGDRTLREFFTANEYADGRLSTLPRQDRIMIKNLDRIKDLLATETQGLEELIDDTDCVCVEGIFALAWGATRDPQSRIGLILNGREEWKVLRDSAFEGTDLQPSVPCELVAKLDLEPWQRSLLEEATDLWWHYLNDELELTFEQFGQLLDLIEQQEAIND